MADAADTGNGASLALGTTGAIGNIRNIGQIASELGKLEDSHLGTTGNKTYIPDDLAEPGEMEVEVEFDRITAGLPTVGTVETATITYPIYTAGNTAANHAGTGFISRVTTPRLANGEIQVMNIRFSFDGKTGPTFTKETTP